jgi:NADH-quinone oxidoreductase subunit G
MVAAPGRVSETDDKNIMPKLSIDNRHIEVPAGTKVIQAAERLDIMIPRFCYHPALGSVGACRVCAVKFLKGPVKGIQMSCMVDAADGMVVSTTDEEAVEFRRHVLELLMLHHPHDCPVCDEGGHCLLQDMTISGGHGLRRYPGKKRTHIDQHLGPLIQHEMNRCIQCYRCSRLYQDYCGYRDLGVMRLGHRVYFGRQRDGTLESPYAGNLTDICPTGVFTDKPSRYVGRRWDYERASGLCLNCSLGCHTTVSARYRETVRQEARYSTLVNGHFICDRGRYGFFYAGRSDRPRQAEVDRQVVSRETALAAAAQKLDAVARHWGAGAIACAGSLRNNLNTIATIHRISRESGWHKPALWMDRRVAARVKTAVSRLEADTAVSLRQVEEADTILVVGADPTNEAPMLTLAMRQAQRQGARVVVIDPRPVLLPFDIDQLPLSPEEMLPALGTVIRHVAARARVQELGQKALSFCESIPHGPVPISDRIEDVVGILKASRRPVIVCGTEVVPDGAPALAADLAILLMTGDRRAGLFYVFPGANAFAAALPPEEPTSFEDLLAAIEAKTVRALVLVECDPLHAFADRPRLEKALPSLDVLVVMDYLGTGTVKRADVFLPTATIFESGGQFINQEGRLQSVPPAYQGGLSVRSAGQDGHPPRDYGSGMPGADPAAAHHMLAAMAGADRPQLEVAAWRDWLAGHLDWQGALPATDDVPEDGIRLLAAAAGERFSLDWASMTDDRHRTESRLRLVTVDWTFGTEELSCYSRCLDDVAPPPVMFMQTADAEKLGFSDADEVLVTTEAGSVTVALRVVENMRAGVLVLPRHHRLDWHQLGTGPLWVAADRIRKTARNSAPDLRADQPVAE